MKLSTYFLLALACVVLPNVVFAKNQTIHVKGKLQCGSSNLRNVKIKIFDKDTLSWDDLVAEGMTDYYGEFAISGTHHEISKLDLVLKVYHRCGVPETETKGRRADLYIRDEFINNTKEKPLDFGVINMEMKFDQSEATWKPEKKKSGSRRLRRHRRRRHHQHRQ